MSPWGHTLTRHNSFYYALSNSFPFLFSHGLKDATKLIKSSFVFNPDFFPASGLSRLKILWFLTIKLLLSFRIVFDYSAAIPLESATLYFLDFDDKLVCLLPVLSCLGLCYSFCFCFCYLSSWQVSRPPKCPRTLFQHFPLFQTFLPFRIFPALAFHTFGPGKGEPP